MPVTYRFEGSVLRMDLVGVYSSDAIIEEFERALADPSFPRKNPRFLIDVTRSLSLADRSAEDLRRVAEYFAARADRFGRRCAIVAESAVHFGLMRMAVVFAETYDVEAKVFRSEDEALAWLDVAPPVARE